MEGRVGEPHVSHVVGKIVRLDVIVTHPGTLTKQNDSSPVERLALSSALDLTEGCVTYTKLKRDNLNPGDTLSSNLGKTNDLVEESVHRLMETSEKTKGAEANDTDMLPKAEKSQHTLWDHNDGPMAMIYDTNLGYINELPRPTTRYWKRITKIGENKTPTKTPINTEVKKRAGPTPLQELDPNSISMKHNKGKRW